MRPREYIDVMRERWRWIIAGLLLGLVVAAGVGYLMPPRYSAAVTLIVTPQAPNPAGTDTETDVISSQRISTYAEVLKSKRLAGGVVLALHRPVKPEDLVQQIDVTTAPDSLLLTATVTDGSADGAVAIANAVGDEFIKNVAAIEQPPDSTQPPAVVAKIFEPAQPPAVLVAPRPALYLAIGAAAGLLLGVALALLRHALDSRIRSRRKLEEILGVPVLGTIGRDPELAKKRLVMFSAPGAPSAEAFRHLRTNVQFVDPGREHKVILVTSATTGEGRTTTVCNLGLAMADAGLRVLIIDADLRRPAVATFLKIDDSVGLTDVLANRTPLEKAFQGVAVGLDVLPSGSPPPNPSELLGSGRMERLLHTLRATYAYVLIDGAPLLSVTDAAVLAPRADGVLLVVRHAEVRAEYVHAAKDALDAVSAHVLGAVMTMVRGAEKKSHRRRGSLSAPQSGLAPSVADPLPTVPVDADAAGPAFARSSNRTPSPGARDVAEQPGNSPGAAQEATADEHASDAGPRETVDAPGRIFDGGRPPWSTELSLAAPVGKFEHARA